jgi:uncharacterized protein
MLEYVTLFLISLAGSFHCVGMCGGIAAIQSERGAASQRRTVHLFLYHFGKIGSYLFVGALFGTFGALLVGVERLLAFIAGSFMIWIALREVRSSTTGRRAASRTAARIEVLFFSLFRWVKNEKGFSASLALGLFNGLLPCSPVYAFAAKAASTGSVTAGMLTMASFGLGTVPALLFSAKVMRCFSPMLRKRFVSAGAFFIFILGVVTLLRVFSSSVHLGHR